MDRQTEITTPGALLNEKGNLARPGFSRALVQEYRRADVKVSPLRIKEWDYYLVNNGKFALALTVADNGYMGLDSVSLLDLEEGWEITKSPMSFMPLGKKHLPETSVTGDVHSAARGYGLHFIHEGEKRVLIAYMNKFGESALSARVELTECPEDSLVIATPFDKPGHFYYNQKIVGFRASGYVNYNGKTYTFEPSDSFAVLDWGRGVWTYENTWYWSSAAYVLPSGTRRAKTCSSTPVPRTSSAASNLRSPAKPREKSAIPSPGSSRLTTGASRPILCRCSTARAART